MGENKVRGRSVWRAQEDSGSWRKLGLRCFIYTTSLLGLPEGGDGRCGGGAGGGMGGGGGGGGDAGGGRSGR